MANTKTGIVCVGCKKDSSEMIEYTEDDTVTDDGTFEGNKFVCTTCYVLLIPLGLDVGSPAVIQQRMIDLVKKEK